jgi:hypothetical protein
LLCFYLFFPYFCLPHFLSFVVLIEHFLYFIFNFIFELAHINNTRIPYIWTVYLEQVHPSIIFLYPFFLLPQLSFLKKIFVLLGFELRASCLLSRHSTIWAQVYSSPRPASQLLKYLGSGLEVWLKRAEHLLCKSEAQNSNPSTAKKNNNEKDDLTVQSQSLIELKPRLCQEGSVLGKQPPKQAPF